MDAPRDEDGIPLKAGDHITFTFGIPPTSVLARLSQGSAGLCIDCLYPPEVQPKQEALSNLMKWYQVWKASPARIAAYTKQYATPPTQEQQT